MKDDIQCNAIYEYPFYWRYAKKMNYWNTYIYILRLLENISFQIYHWFSRLKSIYVCISICISFERQNCLLFHWMKIRIIEIFNSMNSMRIIRHLDTLRFKYLNETFFHEKYLKTLLISSIHINDITYAFIH